MRELMRLKLRSGAGILYVEDDQDYIQGAFELGEPIIRIGFEFDVEVGLNDAFTTVATYYETDLPRNEAQALRDVLDAYLDETL